MTNRKEAEAGRAQGGARRKARSKIQQDLFRDWKSFVRIDYLVYVCLCKYVSTYFAKKKYSVPNTYPEIKFHYARTASSPLATSQTASKVVTATAPPIPIRMALGVKPLYNPATPSDLLILINASKVDLY